MHDTPNLRLVHADNPGPLTGPGTNTFLVGRGAVGVVDPGPDDDAHLAAILAALDPGERITTILVTHAHVDHSALVPRLKAATGADVLAFGTATEGRSATMQALAQTGMAGGGEGLDHAFTPDQRLADGDRVALGGVGLTAWHTPGHAASHLAFEADDPAIGILTGDVILGWSSTLISPPDGDLAQYLASLTRLAGRRAQVLRPAHGAPVLDPARRIAELAAHRHDRMSAIRTALEAAPASAIELVAHIYTDTPRPLWPAAERNVLAHLIALTDSGEATPLGPLHPGIRFARMG